jgi:uncharacterized protein (TIGR00369 family)
MLGGFDARAGLRVPRRWVRGGADAIKLTCTSSVPRVAARRALCSSAPPAMQFTPPNPDFAARVRDSFARQAAMRLIGATLTDVVPGRVTIALPVRDDLTQQHKFVHGGVVGMIADSAGGYAAFTLMPADASVLTVEYKINMLAPATGETLVARGEVLKPGRTISVVRADVFGVTAGKEKLVATMQQTLMVMHGMQDDEARV